MTNPSDSIISSIRTYSTSSGQFPAPLATNKAAVVFSFSFDLGLNHDFIGYVQAYKSDFVTLMTSANSNAALPTQLYGNGPITIELVWDAQPDLDLHVYEPNNSHVFYGDKVGVSGSLDVDDRNGFGPEHFYTNCSTLVAG